MPQNQPLLANSFPIFFFWEMQAMFPESSLKSEIDGYRCADGVGDDHSLATVCREEIVSRDEGRILWQ